MARKQKLPTCCTRTRSQSVLHMARAMEAFGQIWQHTLGQLCMQMLLCTTAHHLVVGGVGGVEGEGSTVGRLLRAMCHISIHICICTSRSVAGDFGSNVSIALRGTCLRVRTSAHQITNGHIRMLCMCMHTKRSRHDPPQLGRSSIHWPLHNPVCCAACAPHNKQRRGILWKQENVGSACEFP